MRSAVGGVAKAGRQAALATENDVLRVAFVGQGAYFRQCVLERESDGLQPTFLDFHTAAAPGPLLAKLEQLRPHVVLVFRPEIIPPKLFHGLDAVTIGYLTEPLPREARSEHPDLSVRMWWLEQVDSSNFDRIVCFDPLIAQSASEVLPVWRSLPIPVADSLFMDVPERGDPVRLLFIGRSTEHREELLAPIKRAHPIVHIGHGLFGEPLRRTLRRSDVQLNLHNNPYPSFENRVCIALAAGHLVISEPLSPSHALEPGRDFLQARTPEDFRSIVEELAEHPRAFLEVQRNGRAQAERFRASGVYPELIRAACAEVAGGDSARR